MDLIKLQKVLVAIDTALLETRELRKSDLDEIVLVVQKLAEAKMWAEFIASTNAPIKRAGSGE